MLRPSACLLAFVGLALLASFGRCDVRYLVPKEDDPGHGTGLLAAPWTSLWAAFDPQIGLADGDELHIACGEYTSWWGEQAIYANNITILGGYWDNGPLGCTPIMRSAFLFRRINGTFDGITVKNIRFESGKTIRFDSRDDGSVGINGIQFVDCTFVQQGASPGTIKLREITVGPQGILFENCSFVTNYPLIETSWFSISYLSRESEMGPTILRGIKAIARDSTSPLTLEFRSGSQIYIEDSTFGNGSYVAFYRCINVHILRSHFSKQGIFFSRTTRLIVRDSTFQEIGDTVAHVILRPVSITIGSSSDWPLTSVEIFNNTFQSFHPRPLHDPVAAIDFQQSMTAFHYAISGQNISHNRFLLQNTPGVFAISNANMATSISSSFVVASNNWFGSADGPRDEWCNAASSGASLNPDPVNNATIDNNLDRGTTGIIYRPWCSSVSCERSIMIDPQCVAHNVDNWRIALIVGLAVAVVVIIGIFMALLLFRLRLKRSQETAMRLLDDYTTLKTRLWDDITSVQDLLARNNILYINYDDIKFGKQLGAGSYGKVLSGVVTIPKPSKRRSTALLGSMSLDNETIPVAIKELHQSALETYETIAEFLHEVNVMSRFDHPNLLRLLGISLHEIHEKQSVLLITELMSNGSLDTLLFSMNTNRPELSLQKKLRIAEDVAHGMLFLHAKQPAVVHRDLKPGNVLLDAHLNAKIADFGLAKTMDKATATMTLRGTPVYLAPECISAGKFSQASDVFAYGVTMYELFSGMRAYSNESGGIVNLMHRVAHEGLRPDIAAANLPKDVEKLIFDCLETEPAKRPTFAEILTQLRNIS